MAARRLAVVGGGISGLAAAHRLLELSRERGAPVDLTLLEASSRLGGVIQTTSRDGFLVDAGPDSLITEKPWALDLIARLGLQKHVIGTQDQHRRSFVARRGRLHPTPDGFHLLAPSRLLPLVATPLISPAGKLRVGLDLILPRRRSGADETLGQFVTRRLGREAYAGLAQPMISAIYGGDPMELSLLATFPRFRRLEEEHGSLLRAMWAGMREQRRQAARRAAEAADNGSAPGQGGNGAGSGDGQRASGARYGLFASLDGGLQVLTEALARRLPAGAVRTGVAVERVQRVAGGRWRLDWDSGQEEVDGVVVALPAPRAAEVLRAQDEDLSRRLGFIRYGSSATVSLACREADVAHALDGFGFVVPAREGMSLLGCTFVHRKYAGRAPAGHVLLRAFHGDRSRPLGNADLVEATLRDLESLVGLRGVPLFTQVVRYPDAMPQYGLGHLDLVAEIEERLAAYPGLALAGNAYRGVGVPDCVRSGEAAAEALMAAPA